MWPDNDSRKVITTNVKCDTAFAGLRSVCVEIHGSLQLLNPKGDLVGVCGGR